MEKNVKAMDKYLEHANDCYKWKLVQVSDFENKEAAKKKITQKELDRVNKKIKNI
jgi:23S rRNA pseudoU1915 N3-methylase RlmH